MRRREEMNGSIEQEAKWSMGRFHAICKYRDGQLDNSQLDSSQLKKPKKDSPWSFGKRDG